MNMNMNNDNSLLDDFFKSTRSKSSKSRSSNREDQSENKLENKSNCKDTQVRAPGIKRGISGGERESQLVTNSSLLFLDEYH